MCFRALFTAQLFLSSCLKATKDLENYDKERHDEFKRYEMMKEHDRREHLKTLGEDERRKEEEHYEEMRKKHADHPKVNHPVKSDLDLQNLLLSRNMLLWVCNDNVMWLW